VYFHPYPTMIEGEVPPHTIMAVPVQTAVCPYLPEEAHVPASISHTSPLGAAEVTLESGHVPGIVPGLDRKVVDLPGLEPGDGP